MLWKERIGDELYVFHNGKLIYKRWISKGYGMVFDIIPFVPKEQDKNTGAVATKV